MSSSHHDDHYLQEQKPIAFTVPFILASVLILIIFSFVGLCDPKPHHVAGAAHHEQMAPAETSGHSDAAQAHESSGSSEAQSAPSQEHSGAEHH